MARIPKITLQGWTPDGPAYTIHHAVSGFRNRKARRAGTGGEELVGDHDAIDPDLEGPAAFMLLAAGDAEVYAFKAPHVYQVTMLVDGDAHNLLVDAREGDRIEKYGADLSLLEQRALTDEEVAELDEGAELEQPSNVSDGAESQEPLEQQGAITVLTGAQTEPIPATDVPPAPATEQPELTDAEVDALDTELDEAHEDARDAKHEAPADADEPSTGEHDFDGTVAEFTELVEAMEDGELETFAAADSRKGVREAAQRELDHRAAQSSSGDDEDAVGGDGDPASDEEE